MGREEVKEFSEVIVVTEVIEVNEKRHQTAETYFETKKNSDGAACYYIIFLAII